MTAVIKPPPCFTPDIAITRASALALDEGERLRLACALFASVRHSKGHRISVDLVVEPDVAESLYPVGEPRTDAPYTHDRRIALGMVQDTRYLTIEGVLFSICTFRPPTEAEAALIARRELVEGDEVRP